MKTYKRLEGDEFATRHPYINAVGSAPTRVACGIKHIPSALFDDDFSEECNILEKFLSERPLHLLDGIIKGVLSAGNDVFQGVSGVVVNPVQGARKSGVMGLAKGVGKGLAGLILNPVAGAIELAGKTAQGALNTPITVYDVMMKNADDNPPVPPDITPKVFGAKIEDCVDHAERANMSPAPLEFINFLTQYVGEEGIFRVSGRVETINELKQNFDSGSLYSVPIGDPDCGVHEVASLLKAYFRDLPDPLLTFSGCSSILSIYGSIHDTEQRIEACKVVLGLLPDINKKFLRSLMRLLHVVQLTPSSKMSATSLGAMFGPCLFRLPSEPDTLSNMLYGNVIVGELIENYDTLFV